MREQNGSAAGGGGSGAADANASAVVSATSAAEKKEEEMVRRGRTQKSISFVSFSMLLEILILPSAALATWRTRNNSSVDEGRKSE